jgi:hypothetical protein
MSIENMNESNRITLDCLMSMNQKKKLNNLINLNKYNNKDKKFYRKRIINLTKELLLNNYTNDILLDVKEAFDAYIRSCIGFFKVKDETDILQADMSFLDINECLEEIIKDCDIAKELNSLDDIVTPEEANKLMMRTIKINKLPLDDFVTVKNIKVVKEIILPLQKEINLKDPILKNKGIRKKKNINNEYIDNENENENENEKKYK